MICKRCDGTGVADQGTTNFRVCSVCGGSGQPIIKTVFSVGYGNRTPDEFVKLLKDAGITAVMDVRRENSRGRLRCYDAGTDRGMAKLVSTAGIKYYEESDYGNREDSVKAYKEWLGSGDRPDMVWCTVWGLKQTVGVFCVVCACGDPFEKNGITPRCHRYYVAEALLEQLGEGWSVSHL